jgi:probable HAF family extracellular repeat protein
MTAVTTLDDPSATSGTVAWDINDSGQIVGTGSTGFPGSQGFLLSGGMYTTLNVPGGTSTTARGINNQGQIVGDYNSNPIDPNRYSGYIFSSGVYTTFDDPMNAGSGFASTDMTTPYDINNQSIIVGESSWSKLFMGGSRSFRLQDGSFFIISDPAATSTHARGINDYFQIVGNFLDSTGTHSFFFDRVNWTTLDDPFAARGTFAQKVNNLGQIVGYYTDSNGTDHGFFYSGIYSDRTFRTIDLGQYGTHVRGINNQGQLVGDYTDASGTHGFFLTLTPPISWKAAVNGDFANGANWNTGTVPSATDDVNITVAGTYSVTSTANETIDSITTASGVTLGIFAGTFTINGVLGSSNAGTIIVGAGANFVINGSMFNTGAIEGLGGNIVFNAGSAVAGTGTIAVGQGGSVNATGNGFIFHGLGGSELVQGTGNLNQAFSDSGNAQLYFAGNQNQLFGGTVTDWLGVSGNNNALSGGMGNDTIGATGTSNTLVAGSGNQSLSANGDGNVLYAGNGQDWLGTSGNQDQLFGGSGNNTWMGVTGAHNAISGGSGNETLFSNGTSNTLNGGSGNDWVGCSGNNNALFGGSGDDYIAATGSSNRLDPFGTGNDVLFAAPNAHDHDSFAFHPGYGNVTINNFVPQVGDIILFGGWGISNVQQLSPYVSTSADGSLVLNMSGSSHLTLEGIPGGLQNSWFNFNA